MSETFGEVLAVVGGIFYLALFVILIGSYWKIFEKAGKPGWASLIPIYNMIVLLEIVGKPIWWLALCLVPCVNFVAIVLLTIELAKRFGKDTLYAVGMIFLPIVFLPMLAFGQATYTPAPRTE